MAEKYEKSSTIALCTTNPSLETRYKGLITGQLVLKIVRDAIDRSASMSCGMGT
jgi:hypothetical protein